MKEKEKPLGTKAQAITLKERHERVATAIFLIFILSMVILSAYFASTILSPSLGQSSVEPTLQFKPENPNSKLKAALVDQVSLSIPDQAFVQTAAKILVQANYSVDYYSGEKVTVEFYRNLPTHGYNMVILRVHATEEQFGGTARGEEQRAPLELPLIPWSQLLFTSEQYSTTKYVAEQLEGQILQAGYSLESQGYFAIAPSFVTSSMNGTFQNTSVIMMGCGGYGNNRTAKAFIEKGAKAYIGWNGGVLASYTDEATTNLLQHLATEGQTIKQAVENTMKELGPDSESKSTLSYYPPEAGDYAIQNP